MSFARRVAALLFVLALPLFLITTNVRFVGTESLLWKWGFERHNAEARTGIDRVQLDRAADDIAEYFGNDEPYLRTRVVIDGRIEPLYNPRETVHMADVKSVFGVLFFLQGVTTAFVLTYIVGVFVWVGEGSVRTLARQVLRSMGVLATVVIAFAGASTLGFERAFTQFHLLIFNNDFWKLNPTTDHLIQMFPEAFFFEMTLLLGGLTLVEGALLGLVAWWYLWRQRGREDAPAMEESAAPGLWLPGA